MKVNLYVEPESIDYQEFLVENYVDEVTKERSLFIKGPYMCAESVNKNKRLYPKNEIYREVQRFNEEMIKASRSMGELNHPPSITINPERACHLITEMYMDDNIVHGKSKVLKGDGLPCGNLVAGLINNGVKLGMSSRALGMKNESFDRDYDRITNVRLITVDCVADPSYSGAFVNGILEAREDILFGNPEYERLYEQFDNNLNKLPRREVDLHLRKAIEQFIHQI